MKLLHTSDWHVGKSLRGHSRAPEHRAVLAEVASIADEERVDVVLVAGDLFETSAPTPESEEIVIEALLALASSGRRLALVAGNHDHPRRLRALSPLLDRIGVHVVAEPARPGDGGLLSLEAGGELLRLAMVPFISQRGIVRAEQLLTGAADQRAVTYSDRVRQVVAALCDGFEEGTVNVVLAHLMVEGGGAGGGERPAQIVFDYWVPSAAFPPSAQYVALGHLHRPQSIPGACPIRYSGSPLHLDFGEVSSPKSVAIIEATPGSPAATRLVELGAGRTLRTIEGPVEELREMAGSTGDDWLRVRVRGKNRAGLSDEIREWFPWAVDVQVIQAERDREREPRPKRSGRAPGELFDEYLTSDGIEDPRAVALFEELLEVVEASEGEAAGSST